MEDIFVLLILLSAQTTKTYSQPYEVDPSGKCLNKVTHYRLDGSNLCCKKCQPGERLEHECSTTNETKCEPCPSNQHMEQRNFSPMCFSCRKCQAAKGLIYIQNCSSTTMSKCGCLRGMYCILGFENPYCSSCSKYSLCKIGYGVYVPGKADSDVKCKQCSEGTFSDTLSYMDRCRPHTNCHGRDVVRKGNTTSDTVCKPEVIISSFQTSTEMIHMIPRTDTKILHRPNGPENISQAGSDAVYEHSTKSPPPGPASDNVLVAAIAATIGGILLFLAIILLFLWKTMWTKDTAKSDRKEVANGNCETGDKIHQDYLGDTQLTSFTVTLPEQHYLLEKGKRSNDQSQCSNNTETLTRTEDGSSYESIGPLQSTTAEDQHPAQHATLLSNAEALPSQTSLPTQSSSQPTSPQIINADTTSPQVNVNITFHIGNGSSTNLSVMSTDMRHVDSQLTFGEEEESFSNPQQEAGKQSLISVQESISV